MTKTAHHKTVWAQQEVPPYLLPVQPQTSCGSDACSSSRPCMLPLLLVRYMATQNTELNVHLNSGLCNETPESDFMFETAVNGAALLDCSIFYIFNIFHISAP